MRHVILTCKNHTNLRWGCKEIAFTDKGGYNGCRNIFFKGEPTGEGMYSDMSGLICNDLGVQECNCPPSDLIRAPEDDLVKRWYSAVVFDKGASIMDIGCSHVVRYYAECVKAARILGLDDGPYIDKWWEYRHDEGWTAIDTAFYNTAVGRW